MAYHAQQEREALGNRLRELRKGARLSGRRLAVLADWHYTKVYKIENGTTMPSDADLEAWCEHCDAKRELTDLKATARNVEKAYVELKRLHRGGRARFQRQILEQEAKTKLFRSFQIFVVPGLLQTPEYATAMLTAGSRHLEIPSDIEETVSLRMERQSILYRGEHLFHFVLCESVLISGMVPSGTLLGQLDRLMVVSSLPRVRIGIIPLRAQFPYPPASPFWIFDDREVTLETFSAQISVTQPREIALYVRAFDGYSGLAVYGQAAKERIRDAMHDLEHH